jgi:hypothetical protein
MAENPIPRTPSPIARGTKGPFTSPPPISNLTPPPTTEIPRHSSFLITGEELQHQDGQAISRTNRLPTVEEARSFTGEECRELVLELLPLIGETRMQLAHTQLQLNLLSIESTEAAQRAEVEHDMTRREVEVLRAGSPVLYARAPLLNDPRSPIVQVQRQLELALEAGRELESENHQLQHRLRQAKKIIKHLNGHKSQLLEDNHLLRERIKQNRDHIDALRASDPQLLGLVPSSQHQSSTRIRVSKPDRPKTPSHNPLNALLMADQILSRDPSSVPATPSPYRSMKPHSGHSRGTQSLSSLPTTPTRTRPLTANELLSTPVNRTISTSHLSYSAPSKQHREGRIAEDRDSTISATDDEALTDEEIPASQASQAASGMLKRNPSASQQHDRFPKIQRLSQGKLTGRISKPLSGEIKQASLESESDNEGRPRKKSKMGQSSERNLGLGIRAWPSPRR